MKDAARPRRPRRPARFPRHRHDWRDLGAGQPGDWRYRCTHCHRKSRNPAYQSPSYRGPSGGGMTTTSTTTYISYREAQRHQQRRRMR